MGLFSFLFKKPIIIEDEVFGTLQFTSLTKRANKSYCSTDNYLFAPTGRQLFCSIDTDLSGPTPAQRTFFRQIEKDYATLVKALIPVIEDEFQNWKPEFKIKEFEVEFWLTGMTIPRLDAKPVEWDWSFETVHDANHMLTIYMHDDVPQSGVQFDG